VLKSEAINELAAALAKAQAEINNPKFDSNNPFFKSKYASLAAVRDAVIPTLTKYGLSVIQEVGGGQMYNEVRDRAWCKNLLLHSSGQWVESDAFSVPLTTDKEGKVNAQGACAGATYARRASLQALCCVVGDADDDGEAAVGRGGAEAPAASYKPNYKKTGKPDPIGPVGEIPDSTAASPSGANADPAAGKAASLAQGFLNNLAAASTLAQVEGTVKGIVLIAGKLTDEEKASLRDAAAAARLRVAATSPKLVDVPNLLREITGLQSQLGDGMFQVILKKHGGENVAGYGLGSDGLKSLRDECVKAIG
jgi:hypothetical protein